jgi:CRP-like cAMP-binding protein
MEWGMGFGEIGLLLNTKRTATIKCVTPCEVYVLERADYETAISMLPREQRLGPLVLALGKIWELMTGPDGSRRESVDYKTYLKAHIRTSKTLTANSDVEDFDEDE